VKNVESQGQRRGGLKSAFRAVVAKDGRATHETAVQKTVFSMAR
jgi:hypothetical protein